MSSPLETLPTELLDNILVWLPIEAAVNLWKSNTRMSHRLDDHLFGHNNALSSTKEWACNRGDVEVLRAAIARDGDPNFVSGIPSYLHPHRTSRSNVCNCPLIQLGPQSTLRIVIEQEREKALDALLEMGATFETLRERDKRDISNYLFRRIDKMSLKMLEALTRAEVGCWLLNTEGFPRSVGNFVSAGAPVSILGSLVRNPNEITSRNPRSAWTPLSSAISVGRSDIVSMLMEKGADIDGVVEEQAIETKFTAEHNTNRISHIKYWRPCHVPIFAAARYMAKSGSTEMLDLCLHHGADINRKSPAKEQRRRTINHYNITPLMAYLQAIPDFAAKTELDPIAGIRHFISNSAIFFFKFF